MTALAIEKPACPVSRQDHLRHHRTDRARRLMRQALDEKLADSLRDTFPFRGACCARMAE
jgi:hypothetical protein